MAQIRVKNTPSPRLMETIGATNQTVPEAIGELVANSFDARYQEEKLHIVVDMRSNKIAIIDDGKGMTEPILEKAICIGEDMSQYLDRRKDAKGTFGMGLKTSCATLGRIYDIYTRPVGEENEYHVRFNLSDYAHRKNDAEAWDVIIDSNPANEDGPLGKIEHGTAIVISKLKERNASVSAVLTYLSAAFKGHLKTGDSIQILDDTGVHDAKPVEYELITGTKIDIDTYCGPDNAYHIVGWMGLSTQTHNDGNYGFNIYRHNQLVDRWNKSWFRIHLMTSRIVGEVNMDFLDATFYKQGLQQSEVWTIVTAHMHQYLKGMVKASETISKKHNIDKPQMRKKIVSELRDTYGAAPVVQDSKGKDKEDDSKASTKSSKKPSIHDSVKNVVTERSLTLQDGDETQVIEITYLEKEGGDEVHAPFDYIFDGDDEPGASSELQVILYRDHPLWESLKHDKAGDEVVKVLATSDAIYRLLVEALDKSSSEALKIRNEWVWKRTSGEAE